MTPQDLSMLRDLPIDALPCLFVYKREIIDLLFHLRFCFTRYFLKPSTLCRSLTFSLRPTLNPYHPIEHGSLACFCTPKSASLPCLLLFFFLHYHHHQIMCIIYLFCLLFSNSFSQLKVSLGWSFLCFLLLDISQVHRITSGT